MPKKDVAGLALARQSSSGAGCHAGLVHPGRMAWGSSILDDGSFLGKKEERMRQEFQIYLEGGGTHLNIRELDESEFRCFC